MTSRGCPRLWCHACAEPRAGFHTSDPLSEPVWAGTAHRAERVRHAERWQGVDRGRPCERLGICPGPVAPGPGSPRPPDLANEAPGVKWSQSGGSSGSSHAWHGSLARVPGQDADVSRVSNGNKGTSCQQSPLQALSRAMVQTTLLRWAATAFGSQGGATEGVLLHLPPLRGARCCHPFPPWEPGVLEGTPCFWPPS